MFDNTGLVCEVCEVLFVPWFDPEEGWLELEELWLELDELWLEVDVDWSKSDSSGFVVVRSLGVMLILMNSSSSLGSRSKNRLPFTKAGMY